MEPDPDRRHAGIVVVGDDDDETSTVAGVLARRLHRPFLDRTASPEARLAEAPADSTNTAHRAVNKLFDEVTHAGGPSVIAAPSAVLDRPIPRTDTTGTWTVWLNDPTSKRNLVTTGYDHASRQANAEQLCDFRIDTTDGDIDRIVDQIEAEWSRLTKRQPSERNPDRQ